MECDKCRKKLREYAENSIKDEFIVKEMEGHIKDCPVCKRELLMWQDVLERQRAVKKIMPRELKDRVKTRMKSYNTDPQLPRVVRQLQSFNRMLTSPKGCLVVQIFLVLAGFMFYFFILRKDDTNIVMPVLIGVSFIAMIFLIFKKKKGK